MYPFFIPLIVLILTQILKLSIDKIKGNLNLKNIWMSYGGMPSSHTAVSVSITTTAGLTDGFDSLIFAVATVFTVIIMRDAVTFRQVLGQHGQLLNKLANKLSPAEKNKIPKFQERLGHSNLEVLVGLLWGITSTVILYYSLT